jgi:hypothetical protein
MSRMAIMIRVLSRDMEALFNSSGSVTKSETPVKLEVDHSPHRHRILMAITASRARPPTSTSPWAQRETNL